VFPSPKPVVDCKSVTFRLHFDEIEFVSTFVSIIYMYICVLLRFLNCGFWDLTNCQCNKFVNHCEETNYFSKQIKLSVANILQICINVNTLSKITLYISGRNNQKICYRFVYNVLYPVILKWKQEILKSCCLMNASDTYVMYYRWIINVSTSFAVCSSLFALCITNFYICIFIK
jgi:hypothetical protein